MIEEMLEMLRGIRADLPRSDVQGMMEQTATSTNRADTLLSVLATLDPATADRVLNELRRRVNVSITNRLEDADIETHKWFTRPPKSQKS
jgi:hypothetical protein